MNEQESRIPDAPDPTSAPSDRSLAFLFSQIGTALQRRFRSEMADLELEPRQFTILRTIAATSGLSQQELADRLSIPASSMVALLDQLEGRGLLVRDGDLDDRRVRRVALTEVGADLLVGALRVQSTIESIVCAGLDENEQARFLDYLLRLADNLGVRLRPNSGLRGPVASDSNEP